MKPLDYEILTDKSNPKGIKEWALYFLHFLLLGFIFGFFDKKD